MDEMGGGKSCPDEQLSSYFSTQEGLAADDLDAAKKGANAFLSHAETLTCSMDKDSCCAEELKAAKAIAAAGDIAAARTAFKAWSDTLIAKADTGGFHGKAAFKMHCPMAFGNKGGTWLQATKDLRNPYYGSMMLTCGMQTGSYDGSESGEECCESGGECCSEMEKKEHSSDHTHHH